MQLPYVWDAPRPYVHPLTTPSGAILSVEAPADHPWHHALWFTIKFVNGENFWEEYDEFGTLRTTSVTQVDADTVRAELDWIAPDGASVRLREARTIRTTEIDAAAYAIDWYEELTVPADTVFDRTPFTTWGGYGGLTLRGAPTWTDTVLRLADGTERERALGEPSRWLAIDGTAHEGVAIPSRAGVVIFDHPDNPRFPTPWYASTRADTYGEGWANFVNAAFLWDEPLTITPATPLALRYRVIVRDGTWATDRIDAEFAAMDELIPDSRVLGDQLLEFTVDTLTALVATHLTDWRIPHTFAGHPVDADVRADLLYTLTHLAHGGVTEVCGRAIDDVLAEQLALVDGRATHTFFSYRVAETLLRKGPFADNPLLARSADAQRAEVARAVDSRDWIELLTADVLPRNYAAVLSRCELTRTELGLAEDPAVLEDLVARLTALLSENRDGYLDDSNDRSGRYDIYTADLWLFCEPLATRIGPRWVDGTRNALALVDTVAGPDGAAIPWGRSTGLLAAALTVELAALAQRADFRDDRADAWIRRGVDAFRTCAQRFDPDGVADAHRHRSQDAYRGPARRLQLTLDVLGKLAWAGATLRDAPVSPVASPGATYRDRDELVAFEPDRAAGVWTHGNRGRRVVVPFVGVTRSHYLPVPQDPGTFETPVDNDLVVWAPLVVSRFRQATTGGLPATVTTGPGSVTARWDALAVTGRGPDSTGPALEPVAGSCTTTYSVNRRTLTVEHVLTVVDRVDAIALLVPETARAPLHVELSADAPHATTRVVVDGLAEWATPYSGLAAVHQLDVDPTPTVTLHARVTPKLRVASTAHGHWYDRLLYAPISHRVLELPSPIGIQADATVALADIELLHLHWPEWFGFDDPATHEHLIATLADRGIPVVWTAHNLTPHDRRPEVYDPIYQRWAETADAVIHHSAWGRDRMLTRYRFRPGCRHEVIPHGHFGDLWPRATTTSRAEAESLLGLAPTPIRIGLVGAPRSDKQVGAFLDALTQCGRDDLQVVCWSLAWGEVAPDDPRIAIAEPYRHADEATYSARLAACDAIAFPFDPDGDMLATGTVADAIGVGIPALVSDWPFLTEMLGDAGIRVGHTAPDIARTLDELTTEHLRAARDAMTALRPAFDWTPLATRTADLFERVMLGEP